MIRFSTPPSPRTHSRGGILRRAGAAIGRIFRPAPHQNTARRLQNRKYDAAQSDDLALQNHWLDADASDAQTHITTDLPTLRNRCRYEHRNNTHAKGAAETHAADIVGTGPRLQVTTRDEAFNTAFETAWTRWARTCDAGGRLDLGGILRMAVLAFHHSGEILLIMQDAPLPVAAGLPALEIQPVEADRLYTPLDHIGDEHIVDGVELTPDGRPDYYHISKSHPGGALWLYHPDEFTRTPADTVIHPYRVDRPGQIHGVPWMSPALPLFAQLRRFTLATLAAAETAAAISAVMKTTSPDLTADASVLAMDETEITRNMILSLPAGWETEQFKAEHPNATYADFKRELLKEIGRAWGMPYNVIAGDSSQHNYASGRLDDQLYRVGVIELQAWIGRTVCDRIFARFATELAAIRPRWYGPPAGEIAHNWIWPGRDHVDPLKEAMSQKVRLLNYTTSLKREYARAGLDWQEELQQIAKEQKQLAALGLTIDQAAPAPKPEASGAVKLPKSPARLRPGYAVASPETARHGQ